MFCVSRSEYISLCMYFDLKNNTFNYVPLKEIHFDLYHMRYYIDKRDLCKL